MIKVIKDKPYYENQINLFNDWCDVHYLPTEAQLLWYKIMGASEKNGRDEWIEIPNSKLMSWIYATQDTLVKMRQALADVGLLEYHERGKEKPSRYRLIPLRRDESTGLIAPENEAD